MKTYEIQLFAAGKLVKTLKETAKNALEAMERIEAQYEQKKVTFVEKHKDGSEFLKVYNWSGLTMEARAI